MMSGINIMPVAYEGGVPGLIALLSGEVQFSFISILTSAPLVKGGKLRAVAVTSDTRSPAMPGVPTVAESPGLQGYETRLSRRPEPSFSDRDLAATLIRTPRT